MDNSVGLPCDGSARAKCNGSWHGLQSAMHSSIVFLLKRQARFLRGLHVGSVSGAADTALGLLLVRKRTNGQRNRA